MSKPKGIHRKNLSKPEAMTHKGLPKNSITTKLIFFIMNSQKRILSTAVILACLSPVFAQNEIKKDSVPNTKEVENRNVMLNASADNQPRQVSIGLPSEMSATIYEDGTPVSWTWWPLLPYFYWASSPAYDHVGMTSLSENAITNGSVNYTIDSWTREGGNKFQGNANYTTNIYGLQRFSVAASGPIKKDGVSLPVLIQIWIRELIKWQIPTGKMI